ncbi:lectin-like domain-containing protein [Companilactobacillus nodensis]|nr:hypothetical protein [Companilactobacillus nodensis]
MNLENYFESPREYKGSSKTMPNSMVILKKGVVGNQSDIVQMTNGTNQLASIWGRTATADAPDTPYNYFDVTKEQEFSAWMYFGDDEARSADGMAFVIQNDDAGIDAISKTVDSTGKKNPQTGETIGVWGGWGALSSDDMAAGAIQNSFALEFDTHHNDSIPKSVFGVSLLSRDNYFDGSKMLNNHTFVNKGQHMAWNYPALPNMYIHNWDLINVWFDMEHKDTIHNLTLSGNSIDEAWHHFYFKYVPPSAGSTIAHISYVFDDKNYDGSIRSFNEWNRRPRKKGTYIDIDTKNFNLKPGQKRIRWGFTSSTGSPDTKATTNAIIFESIPAIASININSSLYDVTQERGILDFDQNNQADVNVNNGDKLEFNYGLNYTSGLAESGQIDTRINLPSHVDFTPDDAGIIGKITYQDKSVDITKDELTQEADSKGNITRFVKLKLPSLGYDNNNVQIQLNGKADIGSNVSSKVTNVDQAHTSFVSPHYTGDLMSPQFSINPVEDTLKMTEGITPKMAIQHSQSFEMQGTVEYQKGSLFNCNKLDLHTSIDGGTSEVTELPVTKDKNKEEYDIVRKASSLELGDHTVTLYVSDAKHRFSNKVTYDVTVEKDTSVLKLESSPNYKFQSINQSPEAGVVHRSGDWVLKVESLNSVWSLKAKTSGLVDDKNNPLAGGLIFRKDGKDNPLKDNQVLLDKDDKLINEDKVFDIAGHWQKDSGILLKIRSNASSGSYKGTISWTLTNSIDS